MVSKKTLIIIFIAFLLIGLFFSLKSSILTDKLIDIFFTRYEEIEVKSLFIGEADDPTREKTFTPPIPPEGRIITHISPEAPGIIRLSFKEPISFDGFSVFFFGNLSTHSSALAKDFQVYYREAGDKWQIIDEVRNNTSPVYRLHSPRTISTDVVKIVISQAAFFDTVHYGDLRFFKKQRVGLWGGIKDMAYGYKRTLPAYWFYYLSFFGFLFLPGYVIIDLLEKKKRLKLDPETKLIFSPVFAIIFLFLNTLVYLLVGQKIILDFYLLVFFASLILFFKNKLFKELAKSSFLLLFMFMALLIIFLVRAERDYLFNLQYINQYLDQLKPIPMDGYYGYAFDNLFPWGIARIFLHRLAPWNVRAEPFLLGREAMAIFDRTPILPLITTVVLNIFEESHFIYQRFLEVLAMLYYGAAYLVVRSYFSKRIARIVSVLMLLSVHLTYDAFNAEIFFKYFAIYPMFLALVLINKESKPSSLIAGLLIGMSFFIHPIALIFVAVLFFVYLKRYKISRKFFEKSFVFFFPTFLLFLGWALFSRYMKQKAGLDLPESKNSYLEKLFSFEPDWLFNKLINVVNIFIPDVLLRGFRESVGDTDFFNHLIRNFLRFSLIAALSPIFMIVLIWSLIKKQLKNYWEPLCFGIGPLIVFLLAIHTYSLGGYVLFYPFLLPFLFGLIVSRLNSMNFKKRLLTVTSYPLCMLISLYYFSGVFIKMKCASLVVHCLFMAILATYLVLTSWLLKFVFQTRKR